MNNAATEVGRLPDGWRWGKLGEVVRDNCGSIATVINVSKPRLKDFPFFQGKVDFGRSLSCCACLVCGPPKNRPAPAIFSSPSVHQLAPQTLQMSSAVLVADFAAIRCGKNANRDFILHALRNYEEALVNKGTGSTFEAINRDDLESFTIPLPPLAEQQRIAAILKKQMAAVEKARAASRERLEAVKALPAAFLDTFSPNPANLFPIGGSGSGWGRCAR